MKKNSWLYSDTFLKRCFAIWGHYFVAQLIISIPFAILWGVVVALFMGTVVKNMDSDDLGQQLMREIQKQERMRK